MNPQQNSHFQFPRVTKEQISGFYIDQPETWTASPLVNAVLEAIETVRPVRSSVIASHFGVDSREMTTALHLLTGLNFQELMELWRIARFQRILKEEPGISPKEMVGKMAFTSQGSLWTFLTRHKLIEPLNWHWNYSKHARLREEVNESLDTDQRKAEYKAELNRRKWEFLTKNSK